tara:strand:- start:186 stop:1079 length:894 start_codon:yes stop_codon:yes gene_type:complete
MQIVEEDPDVLLLTGDLGFGVFDNFRKRFPNQFLNVGVAEQNMSMVAAGLALKGKKVFTYSIGNFPTLRCLEQIRNDICYHDLNVTIVSIGGGFSYGALGMSHHATEDLSIMRSLPNIKCVVPSTLQETADATKKLYEIKGPSYLRLDKSSATYAQEEKFNIGKALVARQGNDITLIASGGVLEEALKAAEQLEHSSISCRVLSMHTVKPIDKDAIADASIQTKGIITIEENNILGGLGGAVAEVCMDKDLHPTIFKRIGLLDEYSSIVGDQYFLRKHYGLDHLSIESQVKDLMADK